MSVRPPPGANADAICAELEAVAHAVVPEATFRVARKNSPFATRDMAGFASALAELTKAPIDLPFWTEAAILVESGVDAVVMGPGAIAQAHAPDEWVMLDELAEATELFRSVFASTRSG